MRNYSPGHGHTMTIFLGPSSRLFVHFGVVHIGSRLGSTEPYAFDNAINPVLLRNYSSHILITSQCPSPRCLLVVTSHGCDCGYGYDSGLHYLC
jgi:hypothetical protein